MDMSKLAGLAAQLGKAAGGSLGALREKLAAVRVEGVGGGGGARVTLSGTLQCHGVAVDAALLKGRPAALEAALAEAVNDAVAKAAAAAVRAPGDAALGALGGAAGALDALRGMAGGKALK